MRSKSNLKSMNQTLSTWIPNFNEDNAREALFIAFPLDVSTVTGHLGPGLPGKFPRAAWAEKGDFSHSVSRRRIT